MIGTPANRPAPEDGSVRTVDDLHSRLRAWVRGAVGEVSVTLDPPASGLAASRSISVYPMALSSAPRTRDVRNPSLKLNMRCLVTAWGDDAASMHADLAGLAFCALEDAEFDVDFEPLSPAAWQAFGVVPRPAFVLVAPLRKMRYVTPAPAVRSPPVITPLHLARLHGIVLGPRDIPLMDARIEIPSLRRWARSDGSGRFSFDGVPASHPAKLRVMARGVEQVFDPSTLGAHGQPLVLRLDDIGID